MTRRAPLEPDRTFDPASAFGSSLWAATRLGMTRDSFYRKKPRLLRRGFPKPNEITGHYIKADVDRWIEQQETVPARDTIETSESQGVNFDAI
jgi:predicted DNA-binding transcriptional regulator AlpA